MGNIVHSLQNRVVHIENVPTPSMKNLTDAQIKIIKSTWDIPAAKPLDSGEKILYMYFDKFPHNQQQFVAFRNTPLISLRGTPGFRSHANKIMTVFSTAIDCLGKPGGMEEIIKLLNEVGKSHKRRGISKKAFNELREIILQVLSQVCHLDDEGKDAWNSLLDTVYHVIFTNLDEKKVF